MYGFVLWEFEIFFVVTTTASCPSTDSQHHGLKKTTKNPSFFITRCRVHRVRMAYTTRTHCTHESYTCVSVFVCVYVSVCVHTRRERAQYATRFPKWPTRTPRGVGGQDEKKNIVHSYTCRAYCYYSIPFFSSFSSLFFFCDGSIAESKKYRPSFFLFVTRIQEMYILYAALFYFFAGRNSEMDFSRREEKIVSWSTRALCSRTVYGRMRVVKRNLCNTRTRFQYKLTPSRRARPVAASGSDLYRRSNTTHIVIQTRAYTSLT